jgi:hypothetical protein
MAKKGKLIMATKNTIEDFKVGQIWECSDDGEQYEVKEVSTIPKYISMEFLGVPPAGASQIETYELEACRNDTLIKDVEIHSLITIYQGDDPIERQTEIVSGLKEDILAIIQLIDEYQTKIKELKQTLKTKEHNIQIEQAMLTSGKNKVNKLGKTK